MNKPLATIPDWVFKAEQDYIAKWRTKTNRIDGRQLTGLALSGGGIRSGVFCLGVLQALAYHNILPRFDYLSTVSGGGYVGSALTWFTSTYPQFGVGKANFPYGIDNPLQPPPKSPEGTPLLRHLRRHGSYLDPGGSLSLTAGVAVVLRGLVLNLFVIWLPLATAVCGIARYLFRSIDSCWHLSNAAWFGAWMFPALAAVIFAVFSTCYSLLSGIVSICHKDMPYSARQGFERNTKYILWPLAILLILASLPAVANYAHEKVGSSGVVGFFGMVAGAATGLWSRLMPSGRLARGVPKWAGPIGAALVLYGMGLLAYQLSEVVRDITHPVKWTLASVGLALIVGYVVNLNETTLHRFYRDRLMEAFMPDLNSAGHPKDKRARDADGGLLSDMCATARPNGPYHLICAHQILTCIKNNESSDWVDRWRIRGGDSFVFSPRACGGGAAGWFPTTKNASFRKLSVPTAMAASGAAVTPNAASSGVGPQRNWLFATLMALLNIRLALWIPNPERYGNNHAPAPNHLTAGLAGVRDRLSRDSCLLEIADGGNFENLGVYELLRRGVQTIVVCDATADAGSAFQDLQNLLGRAEADFGVRITFELPPLGPLMPIAAGGRFPLGVAFSKEPFVVGSIRYLGGSACGTLIYLKPAIFEGLRLHLLGYKGAFPDFPDDNTADQFFDEARFEAYRELGFTSVDRMLRNPNIFRILTTM